ncbi:hypothetical protein [Desulfofustis glycolicus]|uniref:Lipoprotein n=1 Tax=Desulfofustis glycolicus DSM 9705 TaxID=1121409 RepID=A0A1M5X800_9BACT|nr:hypothetical protein [Desulfofustis glycolicus]SHH95343.1 hypothetical protein SAMN02745124_02812 [Desulfofustis glycolicus DSM 9705]
MKISRFRAALLAPTALLLLLSACQMTSSPPFQDRYYDAQEAIPLKAGTVQESTWQTFDVVIDYRYQATADTIEVNGAAALGRHYQDLYERLTKLDVYLFLLDDTARVLQSRKIAQALASETDTVLTFSETIALPPGANHLAFGYEGRVQASDPEPNSGSDWFYKLPLARTP